MVKKKEIKMIDNVKSFDDLREFIKNKFDTLEDSGEREKMRTVILEKLTELRKLESKK